MSESQPFAGLEQGSVEWRKARASKITATETSVIERKNQFESFDDLVRKKVRALAEADDEFVTNEAVEHGTKLEPVARDYFEKRTGKKVFETGLIVHDKYPFLAASPDGLVGIDAGIEIKCPYYAKEPYSVFAKEYYEMQCRTIMEVADLDKMYFLCYKVSKPTDDPHVILETVERTEGWLYEKVSARLLPHPKEGLIERIDLYRAAYDFIQDEFNDAERREKHLQPKKTAKDYEYVTDDEAIIKLTKIQRKIADIKLEYDDMFVELSDLEKRSNELKNLIADKYGQSVGNHETVVQILHKKAPIDFRRAFSEINGEALLLKQEKSLEDFRRPNGTRQVSIKYGDIL